MKLNNPSTASIASIERPFRARPARPLATHLRRACYVEFCRATLRRRKREAQNSNCVRLAHRVRVARRTVGPTDAYRSRAGGVLIGGAAGRRNTESSGGGSPNVARSTPMNSRNPLFSGGSPPSRTVSWSWRDSCIWQEHQEQSVNGQISLSKRQRAGGRTQESELDLR